MAHALRVGILGTGRIATRALIEPVQHVPDVAVAAVASRDPDRAAAFAAAHGIPRHCDYERLLADPDLEVIYITLPNALHAEWSIRALEAGKHVLCEKPMASNEAEAIVVRDAVRRTGRVFMEAFHFPYHPFFRRVRDMLDTGAIGPLVSASADFEIPGSRFIAPGDHRLSYALGGGALMDAGCYPIYALRLSVGEIASVIDSCAETDVNDSQVDLRMQARLALIGGETAQITTSFLATNQPIVNLHMTGESGSLNAHLFVLPHLGASIRLEWAGHLYEEQTDSIPSYTYQLREFVRCVRHGAPVLTSADKGALNMRVIDSIYASAGLRPRARQAFGNTP